MFKCCRFGKHCYHPFEMHQTYKHRTIHLGLIPSLVLIRALATATSHIFLRTTAVLWKPLGKPTQLLTTSICRRRIKRRARWGLAISKLFFAAAPAAAAAADHVVDVHVTRVAMVKPSGASTSNSLTSTIRRRRGVSSVRLGSERRYLG